MWKGGQRKVTGPALEGGRGLRSPSDRRLTSPSSDRACMCASLHFFSNCTPSFTSACPSLCRAETHRTGSHVKLRHRERGGREKEKGGRKEVTARHRGQRSGGPDIPPFPLPQHTGGRGGGQRLTQSEVSGRGSRWGRGMKTAPKIRRD